MKVLALLLLTVAISAAQNTRHKRGDLGLGAYAQTEEAAGGDNYQGGYSSYAATGGDDYQEQGGYSSYAAAPEAEANAELPLQSDAGAAHVIAPEQHAGGYDTLSYSAGQEHAQYGHEPAHYGGYEQGYSHGLDQHHHHSEITPIPQQQIVSKGEAALTGVTIHKAVKVGVSQPVPVPVIKKVPVAVKVPYQVSVDRPYPVHVPKYYPVQVERQVPYEVIREVPYPVKVIEKVPVEVPVYVPRYRPVPVPHYIPKPVPVPAPYPVTILVKEHIHKKGGWW